MTDITALGSEIQALAAAHARGQPDTRGRLISALYSLRDGIETPNERLLRFGWQPLENMCMRIAIELGMLEAVCKRKGAPVTAGELASELKLNELLVIRIMRLLTNITLFTEVSERTYAANAMSEQFNSNSKNTFVHYYDIVIPVAANIIKHIRTHGDVIQFPDEQQKPGLIDDTFGVPLFDYFEKTPEQKRYFDGHMVARRAGVTKPWFELYPATENLSAAFDTTVSNVLIVDVGGNQGHDLLAFRTAHPELPGRFILQDLPNTLDNIIEPSRFDGVENVEMMRYDFFTPQPVKGAKIYFFRAILHDWSDKSCKSILANTVAAMESGYSSLLIEDVVVADVGATARQAHLDILMLVYMSGMERTLKQWTELIESVDGLKLEKVWPGPDGAQSIIEVRKM